MTLKTAHAAVVCGLIGLSGLQAAAKAEWTVVNRLAQTGIDRGRPVLQLDVRGAAQRQGIGGEGMAYRPGLVLTEGEIEADLHAGDRFVGIAFRVLDGDTYDAVYFRTGVFAATDPKERAQAVQYVSHPAYSWSRLRFEAPAQYEAALNSPVARDSWFHVRVRLAERRVRVYINGGEQPVLDVPELSQTRGGSAGLWVGNASGGRLKNFKVRRLGSTPKQISEMRRLPDVPYKFVNGTPLVLDLYRPAASPGPLPVLVHVHGGYWDTDFHRNPPNLFLTNHGYAVASVNYSFARQAAFPAQVDDIRDAVRYLRKNARELQLDPDRIAITGDSSGAFLAALMALTPDGGGPSKIPELQGTSAAVQAVLPYFGRFDLAAAPADNRWINEVMLAGRKTERDRLLKEWSPATHVSPLAPPFLFIHGERDNLVPVSESESLLQALRAAGAPAELRRFPEGHHWLTYYDTDPAPRAAVLAFLDRALKNSVAKGSM